MKGKTLQSAENLVHLSALPRADAGGHLLDGFPLLLQLLGHVLQVLPVVPVCVLQELVAAENHTMDQYLD